MRSTLGVAWKPQGDILGLIRGRSDWWLDGMREDLSDPGVQVRMLSRSHRARLIAPTCRDVPVKGSAPHAAVVREHGPADRSGGGDWVAGGR
jgi:hypothetical protein